MNPGKCDICHKEATHLVHVGEDYRHYDRDMCEACLEKWNHEQELDHEDVAKLWMGRCATCTWWQHYDTTRPNSNVGNCTRSHSFSFVEENSLGLITTDATFGCILHEREP